LKEVKEGSKTVYIMGARAFESLDEIIEQYVEPCNEVFYRAKTHQKF
jgi:hypothetical protein